MPLIICIVVSSSGEEVGGDYATGSSDACAMMFHLKFGRCDVE